VRVDVTSEVLYWTLINLLAPFELFCVVIHEALGGNKGPHSKVKPSLQLRLGLDQPQISCRPLGIMS
jgi:hypothetical protein